MICIVKLSRTAHVHDNCLEWLGTLIYSKLRNRDKSPFKKKSDEITPILYDLHWLPIKERIVFKLLMFVYKILNNQAPMYLTLLIDLYVPGRTGLRSANPDLLLLQRKDTNVTNKTYGWRAFNICAPFL